MILATGMIVFSCAEIGSPYRVLTFAWPVTLSLRDCKRARLPYMGNSFWLQIRHEGRTQIQLGISLLEAGISRLGGVVALWVSTLCREGDKNVPLSEAEDAAIAKRHSHAVVYQEP